jgi:hypothetical protein
VSRTADAELVLNLLLENKSASLETIEIVNSKRWSSGAQIKKAINELEKEGLVTFSETAGVVRMTKGAILKLKHFNRADLVSAIERAKYIISPYWKTGLAVVSAIVAFAWLMLSQVLAPEKYCEAIPTLAADWLAKCAALQMESKP